MPSNIKVNDFTRKLILITAILTNLLGNMGFSGLNLGLPSMEREMGFSAAMMGWIPLSMFMSMAAVAAPGAKLADIVGRRKTSIIGFLLATCGLLISALAWNAPSLITSRIITGLGLTLVFTNTTAMLTSVHPPEQRGLVLGYAIGAVYVGLSLGPLICGYLTQWWGWRAIFYFNAAGFIPSFILTLIVKIEQKPALGERLDWVGVFLWITAVIILFFGLVNITKIPLGPIMTAAGLVLAYFYVCHSLKSPNPILDMRLFTKSRRFAFSSMAAFISYCASTGIGFILALYLQYSKGLPSARAGLILMIQPACQAFITPFAGRLSDKIDAGIMASSGMAILCLSTGLLAIFLSPDTPMPLFMLFLILLGIGFATFSAPNSNAIIGSAPPDSVGQASGIITATRLCGQVFSISLTTLIFSIVIGPGKISPDRYPAFMSAVKICFSIFTPICLAAVVASMARGK